MNEATMVLCSPYDLFFIIVIFKKNMLRYALLFIQNLIIVLLFLKKISGRYINFGVNLICKNYNFYYSLTDDEIRFPHHTFGVRHSRCDAFEVV